MNISQGRYHRTVPGDREGGRHQMRNARKLPGERGPPRRVPRRRGRPEETRRGRGRCRRGELQVLLFYQVVRALRGRDR